MKALYEEASLSFAPGAVMELMPGDVISDSIALAGVYELELTRRLIRLARRPGMLVDVGANLGYFSLLWTAANPGNRAVAFEASPRNVELLRKNVAMNGFEDRIDIVPMAAGSRRERRYFDPGPQDQTGWGGFCASDQKGAIEVEVVRIDETLGGDVRIDLLKIDVEGADFLVLTGCERLLRQRRIREIWYEQNKPRMETLGLPASAAQEYLEKLGYTSSPLTGTSGSVVTWLAVPA